MLTHDKLVLNDPVGVRLSIGEGEACPLVGGDFVSIGVVGGRNGTNANLHVIGTEVLGSAAANEPRIEVIALHDGDFVTIDVVTAKDVGGGENLIRRFTESVARKTSYPVGNEIGRPFSGWKFHIEHGDQQYCATSEPFNYLQLDMIWHPGDAYISFKVMSISVLPDGCTEGRSWDEGKLTSGQSLRIRVEGIV